MQEDHVTLEWPWFSRQGHSIIGLNRVEGWANAQEREGPSGGICGSGRRQSKEGG